MPTCLYCNTTPSLAPNIHFPTVISLSWTSQDLADELTGLKPVSKQSFSSHLQQSRIVFVTTGLTGRNCVVYIYSVRPLFFKIVGLQPSMIKTCNSKLCIHAFIAIRLLLLIQNIHPPTAFLRPGLHRNLAVELSGLKPTS